MISQTPRTGGPDRLARLGTEDARKGDKENEQ